MSPSPSAPAIEAAGIRRVYGGTVALAGVDLRVRPGEIHGLLGENGAGKSTLVRILAGLETPDGGTLRIGGKDVTHGYDSTRAAAAGCAFIHQETGLVDDLSLADNIALTAGFPRRGRLIDTGALRAQARRALEVVGMPATDVDRPLGELPVAGRAIVAIARALVNDASVLVLDEPTAALHASEVRTLFDLLHKLRGRGVACILISHRIDEVLAVCDRVTVLRNGRVVAVRQAAQLDEDALLDLIVGEGAAQATSARTPGPVGPAVLGVTGLAGPEVGPLDFTVRSGEILGLTGLADSGASAVAQMIFGVRRPTGGVMQLPDGPFVPSSPKDAISRRVAFVPADRARGGVAASLTLAENLYMNPVRPAWQVNTPRPERRRARELLRAYDVRPPDPDREMSTLSGGNQQKVVLAKWLSARPQLLVLEDPTAAVDVGAKQAIYALLKGRAADGLAVIVVSSDFEEITHVCDRVLVLSRGRIVRELTGTEIDLDAITRAAYGTQWEVAS